MSYIYKYEDTDGDGISIRLTTRGFLRFQPTGTDYCRMPADEVRKLHSALGVWLSENGITTERTPEPTSDEYERVTAEDVRRIVADELTKREALWGGYAHEAARQELRNAFTRAIEMGADR